MPGQIIRKSLNPYTVLLLLVPLKAIYIHKERHIVLAAGKPAVRIFCRPAVAAGKPAARVERVKLYTYFP